MLKINELLKLEKPLVIFDLETTGLSLSIDRVIELAYVKIFPNGRIQKDDIYLNPEIQIPEEATEIHGITDEDVAQKPTFKQEAKTILDIFENCSYGGYNVIKFDLPLLKREFLRCGLNFDYSENCVVDSKTIFHYMEPRTLSAAYKYYCQKEHVNAHSALSDVMVTAEILESQLQKYEAIRDWEFIQKMSNESTDRYVDNERKFYWRSGEAYFAFSKYKDSPLHTIAENDKSFLEWILQADFSEDTKGIVRKALEGEFPKKEKKNIINKC